MLCILIGFPWFYIAVPVIMLSQCSNGMIFNKDKYSISSKIIALSFLSDLNLGNMLKF